MERQPHNNLWAEKLLQASMPDSGEAWADMESLLDRRLPQRFWSDGRRWLLLTLWLLLLIGVCNCPGRGRLFHSSENGSRTVGAHPVVPEPSTVATRHTRSGPLSPASVTAPKGKRPYPIDSSTRADQPALAVTPSGRRTPATPGGSSRYATPGKTTTHPMTPATTPTAFGDITQTTRDGSPVAKTSTRSRSPARSAGRRKTGATGSGDTTTTDGNDVTRSHNPGKDATARKNITNARDTITRKNITNARDTITRKNMTTPGDTAAKKSTPVLVKVVPRKDTLHKKPPAPPQDRDAKEKDHGWVFGIGLNQFFPIGGQKGSTYNPDGLTGTLSDYLPVPMIRFYLNHKAYLQVEAQLNTPQATKKNLVFNSPVSDTSTIRGTRIETSATLQQLYYFNIPLSFHYAVTDELNIGAGLQFSHLSNAIGNFDSTLTNLTTNEVTNPKDTKSFKNDSLFRRIRTNEFRFLIDANYTWKNIVVGVRYNQALSRFINVPLPTGGSTQSRNSSLQIYVRYILWDTRKKKKLAPK